MASQHVPTDVETSLAIAPPEFLPFDEEQDAPAPYRSTKKSRTWGAAQELDAQSVAVKNDAAGKEGEVEGCPSEASVQPQATRRARTWNHGARTIQSWALTRTSKRRISAISFSSTHTEHLTRARSWSLYDHCLWEMIPRSNAAPTANCSTASRFPCSLDAVPSGLAIEVDAAYDPESQQACTEPPSLNSACSWRYLAIVTAAHVLFNFGNSGSMAIPGCVWPAVQQQAGGGEHVSSALLATSAVGNLLGVLAGGFAMDHFPAHLVAFCIACGLGLNIALLPHKRGLPVVALSNAVIYVGIGIVDCSYSALIWTATESGITRTGPYLVAKALGSELGCMAAALIATWTVTVDIRAGDAGDSEVLEMVSHIDQHSYDYSVLAYTFAALCIIGGIALALLPSPRPPVVKAAQSPAPQRSNSSSKSLMVASRACSERLIVLAGACLLMLEMALQVAAMTLLTDSVPAELAHGVLIFFYALSIVALAASVFLARVLPPAMAIAILFSIGAAGCVGMAVFFATGSGCVSLVWVSYGFLCAMTPTFSLTFSLVASLADVSGQRSAILSCGAALGPLATAVLATANPCMLWFAFTALVVVSIMGVLALEKGGVAS
mmetsp:Transcript_20344/g.51183  ORF Transcript_20344/g.51183 Transcript_20344/m.51183 type:complete len:608 (-) Transcript_20344:350-2173(-)